MKTHKSGKITLTKQESDFLEELIQETGVELWSPNGEKRLSSAYGDFRVYDYDFSNEREYQTIAGALTYLTKE